jgi:hypothetical protein
MHRPYRLFLISPCKQLLIRIILIFKVNGDISYVGNNNFDHHFGLLLLLHHMDLGHADG